MVWTRVFKVDPSTPMASLLLQNLAQDGDMFCLKCSVAEGLGRDYTLVVLTADENVIPDNK